GGVVNTEDECREQATGHGTGQDGLADRSDGEPQDDPAENPHVDLLVLRRGRGALASQAPGRTERAASLTTGASCRARGCSTCRCGCRSSSPRRGRDRKSTRLNSSHVKISYAVFCLKKKK